jgi:hypothetical protein
MNQTHPFLIPLSAPVPPNLEQALGYGGEARYVAFYWEPCGDELMLDDGQYSSDGNWQVWLEYTNHPNVAPYLMEKCWRCRGVGTTNQLENQPCEFCDGAGYFPFNFGYSDDEATHWIIVDRQERKAYAAPVAAARQFLQQQWPTVHDLTHNEQRALFDAFEKALATFNATWQPPSDQEIQASLERSRQLCVEMKAWLDEYDPYL